MNVNNIKLWFLVLLLSFLFSFNIAACSSPAVATHIPRIPTNTPVQSSSWSFFILDRLKYPDAVCNDGSPGAFLFRRGDDAGTNKWVLVLQGVGACSSREACLGRDPELLSSIPWQRKSIEEVSKGPDGIFNRSQENNPHFYNWNHVFFIYCSSDVWAGRRLASPETEGINWSGHYILEAIINTIQDQSVIGAPTLSSAEDILFAGSSSGASGVRANINWLAELLRSNQIEAKFKGVLDAGVGPLSAPDEIFTDPSDSWSLYNSIINEDCIADHAESGDIGICAFTEYIIVNDYISTPLFVYHDQSDYSLMSSYGGEIQDRIQNIITALPNAFGPNQGKHFLITKANFYRMTVKYPTEFIAGYENDLYLEEGVSYSFSDLLWLWYSQEQD